MPDSAEFQNLLDALAEPVLVVDTNRQIVLANRAASMLFGDNLEGQNFVRVIRYPSQGEDLAAAGFKRVLKLRPGHVIRFHL